jgi:hypothetical protein
VRFQILLWQAITILLPFLLIIYSDTCHVTAANGVVIATEKKLPSILVDETSVQKIQALTPNIGVVYSLLGRIMKLKNSTAEAFKENN